MKNILLMLLSMFSASIVLGQTTAKEFYNRASINLLSGKSADTGAALADFSEAIRLKPDYDDAYNSRAHLKADQGDLAGALSDYSKAIELSPKISAYYLNRAGVRAQLKDFTEALADCGRAIEIRPKDNHAYLKRGEIRLMQKDPAGALKDFNLTLEVKPDYFAVLKRRAEAYRALGQTSLAEADEKKYAVEMKKFMERLLKP